MPGSSPERTFAKASRQVSAIFHKDSPYCRVRQLQAWRAISPGHQCTHWCAVRGDELRGSREYVSFWLAVEHLISSVDDSGKDMVYPRQRVLCPDVRWHRNQKITIFEVESKAPFSVRFPIIYCINAPVKCLQHVSVGDCADCGHGMMPCHRICWGIRLEKCNNGINHT